MYPIYMYMMKCCCQNHTFMLYRTMIPNVLLYVNAIIYCELVICICPNSLHCIHGHKNHIIYGHIYIYICIYHVDDQTVTM